VIGSTNAFPNFATGAIDNRYPLAHTHLDGSPFSEGTASPADTGPLGATVAASGQQSQPQYADARYPPKASTAEFGNEPGPHAIATAAEGRASAAATYAGTPPELAKGASPQTEQASSHALNDGMTAWRAQYMSPADSAKYPYAAADPNEPDSIDGATASSRAILDAARGLVLTTDSRLARALLGGGSIRLLGVHATLEIVNRGTPKDTVTLDVADATIGGVPVRIGQKGVEVDTQRLPDLVGPAEQASAALNEALGKAGFQIRELGPKISHSASEETVLAAAADVRWEQPPSAPGVPQQAVELRIGEAFADSLAMPEIPLGVPKVLTGPIASAVPSVSGTSPGPTVQQLQRPSAPVATRAKPGWLLLAYVSWQSLIAGTVASLWLWRAEGVAA